MRAILGRKTGFKCEWMLKRCYKAYFRERFLLKNLEGIGKVSNFALAFGNGGSAGAAAATAAAGSPEKPRGSRKKKLRKILVIRN